MSEKSKYQTAVEKVYESLDECIIIGLTGRTGSGCTTTAGILSHKNFSELELATPKHKDFKDSEERKAAIVYKYMSGNWKPFTVIEASSIIFSFIAEQGYDNFIKYLEKLQSGKLDEKVIINGYETLKDNLEQNKNTLFKKCAIKSKKILKKHYYIEILKSNKNKFYEILKNYSCTIEKTNSASDNNNSESKLYTYLMQKIGNNIRSSGKPYESDFDGEHIHCVAERINSVIEIIKAVNKEKRESIRICIDAIRNPYEAYYFKDLYKSFYLVSVGTDDSERRLRLANEYNAHQLDSLDEKEYPAKCSDEEMFYQQDIAKCLQIADIHLYNPTVKDNRYDLLTASLVKYIALMLHPGLITPSRIERSMQVAFTAKFNSGCLSRQVGAVITDEKCYVKAIGWNDAPQGQVSCNLRSVHDYFSDKDERTYSQFELENQNFNEKLKTINDAYKESDIGEKYNIPFCFKDIYNVIKKDKNQVYTRSLHAEENAFLQLAKFGGQGIQGGKLFVTASPCELCSKKSYQLGIKDIYYIDPYPGIATTHVLKIGDMETNPKLHLYYGAIGNAYVSLYMQRFAIKDELQLLSGVKTKEILDPCQCSNSRLTNKNSEEENNSGKKNEETDKK